jgi:hypothetical protein
VLWLFVLGCCFGGWYLRADGSIIWNMCVNQEAHSRICDNHDPPLHFVNAMLRRLPACSMLGGVLSATFFQARAMRLSTAEQRLQKAVGTLGPEALQESSR